MVEALPQKAFFVRMDLDCLPHPPRLLALLRFLHWRLVPKAAVFFGSKTLAASGGAATSLWSFDVDLRRRALLREIEQLGATGLQKRSMFTNLSIARGLAGPPIRRGLSAQERELVQRGILNKSTALQARTSYRPRAFLRETAGWAHFEAAFLSPVEAEAAARVRVSYAAGQLFGFSRVALEALVRSDCMRRVGQVKCDVPCRRSNLQEIEDAATGLCMHLLKVPFVEASCIIGSFAGMGFAGSRAHSMLAYLTRQSLERVRPECRRPIAFHPVKNRRDYLKHWELLTEVNREADRLAARNLSCGSAAAAAAERAARESKASRRRRMRRGPGSN